MKNSAAVQNSECPHWVGLLDDEAKRILAIQDRPKENIDKCGK